MRNNTIKMGCLTIGLILAMQAIVLAHAQLDHASPAVGSKPATSPAEVKIWFDQEIQANQCTIEVDDSSGKQIDKKDTHGDAKDNTLLSVSVPTLPPGKYKVIWHAVCALGHHTQGDFQFEVKPKG